MCVCVSDLNGRIHVLNHTNRTLINISLSFFLIESKSKMAVGHSHKFTVNLQPVICPPKLIHTHTHTLTKMSGHGKQKTTSIRSFFASKCVYNIHCLCLFTSDFEWLEFVLILYSVPSVSGKTIVMRFNQRPFVTF